MVKSDYVAYHNVEEMGEYRRDRSGFAFFSRKHRKFLEAIAGSHVWVITGSRNASGVMVYRLAAVFVVNGLKPREDGCQVTGVHGFRFPRPVSLNALPWFEVLYREQHNFSFGVSRIRSDEVIAALDALRAKAQSGQKPKKAAGSPQPRHELPALLTASDLYPAGQVESKRR